jgi:hypothetical protein
MRWSNDTARWNGCRNIVTHVTLVIPAVDQWFTSSVDRLPIVTAEATIVIRGFA